MRFWLGLGLVGLLAVGACHAPEWIARLGPAGPAPKPWVGCVGIDDGETAERHMARCAECRARTIRIEDGLRKRGLFPKDAPAFQGPTQRP